DRNQGNRRHTDRRENIWQQDDQQRSERDRFGSNQRRPVLNKNSRRGTDRRENVRQQDNNNQRFENNQRRAQQNRSNRRFENVPQSQEQPDDNRERTSQQQRTERMEEVYQKNDFSDSPNNYLVISHSQHNDDDNAFAMLNVKALRQFKKLVSPILPFLNMNDPRWGGFVNKERKFTKNLTNLGRQQFIEINLPEFEVVFSKHFDCGPEPTVTHPMNESECPICKKSFDIKLQLIAYTECFHFMCLDCCVKCFGLYQACPVCRQPNGKVNLY
ncbi:hypothetical protein BLA29_009555, partial [Euroglyphus maynei]